MNTRRHTSLCLLAVVALTACGDDVLPTAPLPECSPVDGEVSLKLQLLDINVDKPILAETPAGDDRLFVLEQHGGRIFIFRDNVVLPDPFVDLSGAIGDRFEQGLLSVVFHPQHSANRLVYISFSATITGDNVVMSFETFADNPDQIDLSTARTILGVHQPYHLHNGGRMAFGPDGYLYIGIGNGVSVSAERPDTAQDRTNLLGTVIRIDVDSSTLGQNYTIPADNPFIDEPYVRPEIWHYGLRNPWALHIDSETGYLYIGDVGEVSREELDISDTKVSKGLNYGSPIMEGSQCGEPGCDQTGLTLPTYDWGRDQGCAVIGGTVYRGCNFPAYQGEYFFTDWCEMFNVRSIRWDGSAIVSERQWPSIMPAGAPGEGPRVSSIVSGPNGELFIADHFDDKVYAIVLDDAP